MVESTNTETYEVPYAYTKHFNPESVTQLVATFKGYDKNKDGKMDKTEFKQALKDMGESNVTDEQVDTLLGRFDRDNSGFIDAAELRIVLEMMGQKVTEEEIYRMIAEASPENTGQISLE